MPGAPAVRSDGLFAWGGSGLGSLTSPQSASPFNVQAGDLLLVAFGFVGTGASTVSLTDSQGNSYSLIRGPDNVGGAGGINSWFYSAVAKSSGTLTVTLSWTGGSFTDQLMIAAVAFVGDPTAGLAQAHGYPGNASTSLSTAATAYPSGGLLIAFIIEADCQPNLGYAFSGSGGSVIVDQEASFDGVHLPCCVGIATQTYAAAGNQTLTVATNATSLGSAILYSVGLKPPPELRIPTLPSIPSLDSSPFPPKRRRCCPPPGPPKRFYT